MIIAESMLGIKCILSKLQGLLELDFTCSEARLLQVVSWVVLCNF